VRERPARLTRDFGEGSSVSRVVVAEWANLSARKLDPPYVAVTARRRKPVRGEWPVQVSKAKKAQSAE
jgi:hypothetical protein